MQNPFGKACVNKTRPEIFQNGVSGELFLNTIKLVFTLNLDTNKTE